jgi:O-antigen/teichoic acid export membrane protein
VQALSGASGSILAALDKMKLALRLSAARTALNVAAFVVGLHWGMRGVAVAYAVSSLLMFVPTIVFTTRSVDRGAGAFLRAISGPVQATIAMVVVLLLLRQLLISEHVGPAARLGLLVLCGAAVYVAGVSWRDRSLRRDVRGVALSLLGRRGEPVTIG